MRGRSHATRRDRRTLAVALGTAWMPGRRAVRVSRLPIAVQ